MKIDFHADAPFNIKEDFDKLFDMYIKITHVLELPCSNLIDLRHISIYWIDSCCFVVS